MAIFDHIRALIAQAPANTKTVVACVPRPGSGVSLNFADLPNTVFHDELGIIESRGPVGSLFFHAADLQRVALLNVTGSLGETVARDMPDAWAMVNDAGKEALNATMM